ncbi:hypothetical protein TRVL_05617 [Trypanosoma vivax]|nr:hypothetical protein TRVL_05617 [Trypanosoma vivax]
MFDWDQQALFLSSAPRHTPWQTTLLPDHICSVALTPLQASHSPSLFIECLWEGTPLRHPVFIVEFFLINEVCRAQLEGASRGRQLSTSRIVPPPRPTLCARAFPIPTHTRIQTKPGAKCNNKERGES